MRNYESQKESMPNLEVIVVIIIFKIPLVLQSLDISSGSIVIVRIKSFRSLTFNEEQIILAHFIIKKDSYELRLNPS